VSVRDEMKNEAGQPLATPAGGCSLRFGSKVTALP
jgi:hypothetical protein